MEEGWGASLGFAQVVRLFLDCRRTDPGGHEFQARCPRNRSSIINGRRFQGNYPPREFLIVRGAGDRAGKIGRSWGPLSRTCPKCPGRPRSSWAVVGRVAPTTVTQYSGGGARSTNHISQRPAKCKL